MFRKTRNIALKFRVLVIESDRPGHVILLISVRYEIFRR